MSLNNKYILILSLLFSCAGSFFVYQHLDVTQSIIHDMERVQAVLLNRMIETATSSQIEGLRDAARYNRQTLTSIAEMRNMVLVSVAAMVAVLIFAVIMLNGYMVRRHLGHILTALRKAAEGDMTSRVPVEGEDSYGELAATINRTLARFEQLQNELNIRHAEQVAYSEKMASLGEVATTVAHEIKNPLAGISGALQVLAEEYDESNPRREIANDILNEIERLDKSIKDLLLFARPPEPHLILTDIRAIIEKVRAALAASSAELGIKILTEFGPMPEIRVDPDQMEKALVNIGTHSLHAMGKGGGLTITTRHVPDSGECEIIFTDTRGPVEAETLETIFKPSFSSRDLGAGFRLAISRNIIESHKGRVLAESVAGQGTRFRIVLPGER